MIVECFLGVHNQVLASPGAQNLKHLCYFQSKSILFRRHLRFMLNLVSAGNTGYLKMVDQQMNTEQKPFVRFLKFLFC